MLIDSMKYVTNQGTTNAVKQTNIIMKSIPSVVSICQSFCFFVRFAN